MTDTTLLLPMLGLLLVVGAFAGVLAGLLGVGGGIVLVPAFYYVFAALGYDGPQLMQVCLATSLATIVVTSLRSVNAHNKKGAVDRDILKTWVIGIVIGALVGVVLAVRLRSEVLQGIFAILAMIVGLYMLFGRDHWRIRDELPTGVERAGLSTGIGFFSALMGIGGGSFGVPLMTLYGVPIHRAVATSAGFGLIIAVPSVFGFLMTSVDPASRPPLTIGAVNLVGFAVISVTTYVTTPWGVKLAHATNPKPLKKIFAVFLILVALNMMRRALGW